MQQTIQKDGIIGVEGQNKTMENSSNNNNNDQEQNDRPMVNQQKDDSEKQQILKKQNNVKVSKNKPPRLTLKAKNSKLCNPCPLTKRNKTRKARIS